LIKILFDLKKQYYLNSLYPLYREIENDSDYDPWIYVGKDQKRFLGIFFKSKRNLITSQLREKGYKITDNPTGFDVVVCADALWKPENYGKAIKIHLDHGVGIKTLRIRNIFKQSKFKYHVFLEGQYWLDYIKSVGMDTKDEFYLTGIPKLDPFFWGNHFNNDKLSADLGINSSKKTVLYAPSYRPSCIPYMKDRIMDLVPGYNLLIKLHPYSWEGKYAPHYQHKFYEKLVNDNPDVHLISEHDYDIYPYLFLADTLISDTSSVINEFLALGKFGIIFELPYDKLIHSDGMPILSIDPKEWLAGAFPHINAANQIVNAVESALNPTEEMKTRLKVHRDYYFTGLDGKSGRRVKQEIDRLTGNTGP